MKNENEAIIVRTKKQNCMMPQAWAFPKKDYDDEDIDGDSDYAEFASVQEAVDYYSYIVAHAKADANGVWQLKISRLALEALENL